MKLKIIASLGLLVLLQPVVAQAKFSIAQSGKPVCVIIQQSGATTAETHAAQELAQTLSQMTGATFEIQTNDAAPANSIIIGPGPAAAKFFPEIKLDQFDSEEFVMRVKNGHLLLAGGRPRGTLYAVNRFLQEQCGVRWWTPWTTNIPHRADIKILTLNVRAKPAFEYRVPYWSTGFDPLWKMHNGMNGENSAIPTNLGGSVTYKGFCHTFYPLVPPEKYFAPHPEWYSLVNGKRTHQNAQLCLSNPDLRDFVVAQAREWLRSAPDASIISITQNDCDGHCQCPNCRAIDNAEGSPEGSMLTFVNYVAEKLEPEFPHVYFDTFAYQYTRKPPKTVRPRHNVIVRLCSIECNFREPLDDPSNASFLDDLTRWSQICSHLYIWDYTTDFGKYINPYPNWFTMGANIRLFQKYGVKGVFEEGAYGGAGADMASMRAWLLAQLLWNPQQNDRALIKEFLDGYYGPAADPIRRYLDLVYHESKGFFLRCGTPNDVPYLHFKTLSQAERLWQQAETNVASNSELLERVRLDHLSLRYAWLAHWTSLRRECWEQNADWPLSTSRKTVADEWRTVAAGVPGKDWTHVTTLNEPGLTVEKFLAPFAEDPPDTNGPPPIKRLTAPVPPPKDLYKADAERSIDLQDDLATLYRPGRLAEIRPDPAASDYRAVWMPGSHKEWAFRIPGTKLPSKALTKKCNVFVIARVEPAEPSSTNTLAFSAGVYDIKTHVYPADKKINLNELRPGYSSYMIGSVQFTRDRDIYIAPPDNDSVKAIYIDRVYLTPAD